MTRIDQIIADALAGSPDTVVHQLASEVVRLRGDTKEPSEKLFHKNCRSCICWNGDMCELISHICENGEQWLPSADFVAAHPEVAALVDFAEQMRASASQFSAALDAVQKENADLKRGGVVVPDLTDDEIHARLLKLFPDADADPSEREWCFKDSRWAYNLATSRACAISADRVLGDGMVAMNAIKRKCQNDDEDAIEALTFCGYGEQAELLEAAIRANQGGADHD